MVQFSKRRAEHCTIPGAQNARVIQAVLFEDLASARPGKAGRGAPLQRRIGQKEILGTGFASRELKDDGVRGRRRAPGVKIIDGCVSREVMALVKEMNDNRLGHALQGDIEQSLLLPHDVVALNLHEYFGIFVAELKRPVEREFNGYQGNRKMSTEYVVVLEAPPVSNRVEVAGDSP